MMQFSSLERGQILLHAVHLYFRILLGNTTVVRRGGGRRGSGDLEKRKGASGDAPGSDPLMPDVDPHSHNVFGFAAFVLRLFAFVFAFLCGFKIIVWF